MASIAVILRTIQAAISTGINAAGITTPGQTIIGWPTGPQGAAIWGAGQYLVSIFPQKTQPATRYKTTPGFLVAPPVTPLVATVTATSTTTTTVALTGTNAAGLNIHTVVGPNTGPLDTLYQTTGAETLAQLATAIAAKITALGYTASTSGANVLITGHFPVWCNVGLPISATPATGYPIYVQEVARFTREVLVTVWASIPDIGAGNSDASRENIENAVVLSLGGRDQPYQYAPDNSTFSALWSSTGDWSDKAESSYTVFRSDNYLEIEYGLLKPVASTPVGAVKQTSQVNTNPSTTEYFGGP